ncbi:MAG: Crp/Fnr family transcriptional regulator [Pseudomonadota bacterium]
MDRDDHWISRFESLSQLPNEARSQLAAGSQIAHVGIGQTVFRPGQSADNLLLLLEGSVRVQQVSDTGREVFLYRVHAGESCVLTTACMLAFENYAAEGVTETDVTAVIIPRGVFDALIATSKEFRAFVFSAYSRRITDLFKLIDDIVFQPLDVRLAKRLLELADENGVVPVTHSFLGNELGTAREVISRALGEFQRRGWVSQQRGKISLLATPALKHLAETGSA